MAYTVKIQALDAICRSHGGSGGHGRAIRALNEWCVLLGRRRRPRAQRPRAERDLRPPRRRGRPLPGDPRPQRHRRPPRRRRRPPPQPRRPDRDRRPHRHRLGRRPGAALRRRRQPLRRRPAGNPALRQRLRAAPLLGAQPRRLGAARQGGARRAHRPLRHRRLHACSNGSTPTSPAFSPPWPRPATRSCWCTSAPTACPGSPWPTCRPRPRQIIAALTGAGAPHPLAPGEPALRRQRARARRTRRSASPTTPGCRRSTAPTAAGS